MPRTRKPKARADKRDELIDAALRLFDRHGYHATGIDTILAEAGVAKMTLYHHFASKDELILAALRKRDAEWRAWFRSAVEVRARTPRARLRAIFEVIEDWFRQRDYHGCSFGQAAMEFREPRHAVHKLAQEHEQQVLDYLRSLAADAGARDPDHLARQLVLLMEGAVANMEIFRDTQIARTAGEAAQKLVDAAIV